MVRIRFVRRDEPVFNLDAYVGAMRFAVIIYLPSSKKYSLIYERCIPVTKPVHVKNGRTAARTQFHDEQFASCGDAMRRVFELAGEDINPES